MYIENQVFIKKQRLNYCIYYIKWQCVTLWISSPEWDAKDKCLHVHVCWRLFFANSITLELDCFHRLPLYCVVKNISTEGKTKYESKQTFHCRLWIISSLAMRCVVLLTRDISELSLCDQSLSRSLGSLGRWKLMMPASRSTLA